MLPGAGDSGSRIAHPASVTDDQYTAQPCPPAAWGGHDGQRVYVVPSQRLVFVRMGFSPEVYPADLRVDELVRDVVTATRS